MMKTEFDWESPPLSADDSRLIQAYLDVGVPADALAYSDEFEAMCRTLMGNSDRGTLRTVYQRLLFLRKQARLPRLGSSQM